MGSERRRNEVADVARGFEQMLQSSEVRRKTEQFIKRSGTLSLANLEKQFTR
jgi:hypothetical protein